MPTITFNTIQELTQYLNQYIVENNNNEIKGVQHNNFGNGVVKFITESPRNWDAARVISSAGLYQSVYNDCIIVFKETAIGAIGLADNKWNEFVIINQTSTNKSLLGGTSITYYKNINNLNVNYIPAKSTIKIVKGTDGLWYDSTLNGFLPPCESPSITSTSGSGTYTQGANITLSVSATGTTLSYQWQKDISGTWTDITDAINSTYMISNSQTTDSGSYRVIVSNECGDATSGTLSVTVNAAVILDVHATWVDTDPYAQLQISDDLTYQWNGTMTGNNPIPFDTRGGGGGNHFYVFKYPSSRTSKTSWYNTALNNDTIPGGITYPEIDNNGYKYVVTRFAIALDPTQFTTLS